MATHSSGSDFRQTPFMSMSCRRSSHGGSPSRMSNLLSGSVADEHLPESNRVAHSRPIQSYDPFSSVPHTRHSPPRNILVESPALGNQGQFQGPLADKHVTTSYSPYTTSYPVARSDGITYNPYDNLQATKETAFEAPVRRISMDQVEAYLGPSVNPTHTTPKVEHRSQFPDTVVSSAANQTRRRPLNQDEFDGPTQFLPLPLAQEDEVRTQALPNLPMHLNLIEQDEVMRRCNDALAACAFHFVAKYQFPIPLEREKPPVRSASDREWTEWAYLLKRLATKRRIPARLLRENQIKHLVTILENSVPIRNSRPRDQPSVDKVKKDDRYLLQLISAGIQVAKILMDSLAMEELMNLYVDTETVMLNRR